MMCNRQYLTEYSCMKQVWVGRDRRCYMRSAYVCESEAKLKRMASAPAGVVLLLAWLTLLAPVSSLHTDGCDSPLGMQSGDIPDDHITASSYFDAAVNAIYARARVEHGGGAWCPREMIYREGTEFLEVNLGGLHVITKVEVQGRFGNGQGREFARQYRLKLWRPGLDHWVTYADGHGEELLEGNTNTYLAKTSQLSPPIIASRVRFVPYSDHPRTVCMRVEIYGCPYTAGIVSYKMPDGDPRGGNYLLRDLTYDGTNVNGLLSGGLGQLSDGETGHTNFRVDALGLGRGYEWVGWRNDSRQGKPVEINFEFDVVRNFSAVHLYTNNFFTRDTQVFSHVRVLFSVGGKHFDSQPAVDFHYVTDRIFENARNVTVKLHNVAAKFVKLQLYFSLRWIMVSEIEFESEACKCNLTDESPVLKKAVDEAIQKTVAPAIPPQPNKSSGLMVGGLITLGVVFGVVPVGLCILYYRMRLTNKVSKTNASPNNAKDSAKVSMKVRDLHINMNLSRLSNGCSRAKRNLYGHVAMEDSATIYKEPFKGPVYNPGYHTLGQAVTLSDTSLKCPLPSETDDSVDYAVPGMNITPPPPFSDSYTPPPPPVPVTRPPALLHKGRPAKDHKNLTPPTPPIPPPPKQQYITASQVCQSTNIRGTAGNSAYAVLDSTLVEKRQSVPEVGRHCFQVTKTIGEGSFGRLDLCEVQGGTQEDPQIQILVMRCLNNGVSDAVKERFLQEAHVLSCIDDPNITRLIGMITRSEPLTMVLEYLCFGDLCQFLQRHVSEASVMGVRNNSLNEEKYSSVLSYGSLIFMASQIASGMKHLEKLNLVHRDLAARNCFVGRGLLVKISDIGMSQSKYHKDYYHLKDGIMLPIRWMAWESILQAQFSIKSDVWAFGVTLWEIFTMGRQQPYEELSDDGVLENISHCYNGDGSSMILLPHPPICPREMYDMMTACWRPNSRQRPLFGEILMFLQRKNLGFSLDYPEYVRT